MWQIEMTNPTLFVGLAMVLVAVGTAGLHFFVRSLLNRRFTEKEIEAANWGAFRIGAIHALVLSLTFAEVQDEFNDLKGALDQAGLALLHTANVLNTLDDPLAVSIKKELREYAEFVISSNEGAYRNFDPMIFDNPRYNEFLANTDQLIENSESNSVSTRLARYLDQLREARDIRFVHANEKQYPAFWVASICGFLFTCIGFLVYRPGAVASLSIGLFGGLNGAMFSGIYLLSNPFSGFGLLEPTLIVLALEKLQ